MRTAVIVARLAVLGACLAAGCQEANPAFRPGDGGLDGLAAVTSAALLGYWKLDDAPGSLGARDSSGRGHNATLENMDRNVAWVAGRKGGGLLFPRDTASAGLLVGLPPAIRDLRRFTIAAWTYRDSFDDSRLMSVMSRRLDSSSDREVYNMSLDRDTLVFYMHAGPTSATFELRITVPNALDRWHHVAATFDGSRVALYLDGLEGLAGMHPSALASSDQPLYVGTNKNASYHQPFDGILDEVMLYGEALGREAVKALHDGMTPPLP
jgi:hypothetical protein